MMGRIRHPPEDQDVQRDAALAIVFGAALVVVVIAVIAIGTLMSGAGQCGS